MDEWENVLKVVKLVLEIVKISFDFFTKKRNKKHKNKNNRKRH